MSKSARSVFVFAVYLFLLGVVLLGAPNLLLGLFGLPEAHEVWIRVVGMLTWILGYYYTEAARHELRPFLWATVFGRGSVILFFGAFVALGLAPPVLLLFGVVDLLAALWTAACLRSES